MFITALEVNIDFIQKLMLTSNVNIDFTKKSMLTLKTLTSVLLKKINVNLYVNIDFCRKPMLTSKTLTLVLLKIPMLTYKLTLVYSKTDVNVGS